jgi:hypothetical protein
MDPERVELRTPNDERRTTNDERRTTNDELRNDEGRGGSPATTDAGVVHVRSVVCVLR